MKATRMNVQASLCSDAHGLYVNTARSLLAELDDQDYHEAYDGCLELGVNARSKKEELVENELQIELFPNPTSDLVTINASIPMDMVSLYDIGGNLVLQLSAKGNLSVSIENISSGGMYIVEIRMVDDQGIIYKKLIKN